MAGRYATALFQLALEQNALDAVSADLRQFDTLIAESADLIYHLVVLWAEMAIKPNDIWAEMLRREKSLGIAEKLPKEAA